MNDLYFPAFETGGRIVEVDIIFKKSRIYRAFGSVARIYNAWLRSGRNLYASSMYSVQATGVHHYGETDLRYAVRPASSNAVNF